MSVAKDNYREVKNKDVYSDDCCQQPSASYSDEYVRWLEEQYEKKVYQVEMLFKLNEQSQKDYMVLFETGKPLSAI